jgi:Ca2+-binding EF-hand superfamily protein
MDVPIERQVLRFYGFFKEAVHESPFEGERSRLCVVYYYLSDGTLHVSEPKSDNSQIPQGVLVRRHRIEGLAVDSLNVGEIVEIYGKRIYLCDCDRFTREYLTETFGMEVPEGSHPPANAYERRREKEKREDGKKGLIEEDMELKRFLECSFTGLSSKPSRTELDKAQKYLAHDRHVLRLFSCWDDSKSLYGDYRYFTMYFFLADDTMEVTEQIGANTGRDSASLFVSRQKVPREFKELKDVDTRTQTSEKFYSSADFHIGAEINVYSRNLLIYDCDAFTKAYLREVHGQEDFSPIPIKKETVQEIKIEPPPYNGFGDEEDSLNNWKFLVLKPPRKDFKKMMEYDRKKLRFTAHMISKRVEDSIRTFMITYYLSDDTLSIYEPMQRNTGIIGGKFLGRKKVPGITPKSLFVGAEVDICSHRFELTGTDEATLRFMESRPRDFTLADANVVLHKLRLAILAKHVHIRDAFRSVDTDHSGNITYDEFKILIQSLGVELFDQEVITIMRYFDKTSKGFISYGDFCDAILPQDYTPGKLHSTTMEDAIHEMASEDEEIESRKRADEEHQRVKAEVALGKFQHLFETRPLYVEDSLQIECDRSDDSMIGEPEFRKVMETRLSLILPKDQTDALCAFLFRERKRVTLKEFLHFMEGFDTWKHTKK